MRCCTKQGSAGLVLVPDIDAFRAGLDKGWGGTASSGGFAKSFHSVLLAKMVDSAVEEGSSIRSSEIEYIIAGKTPGEERLSIKDLYERREISSRTPVHRRFDELRLEL